eukprot:12324645-Ditylum_brightwellii.AAC.1
MATPAGLTKDTIVQYTVRIQKHYLQNYLRKPKEFGIWHVVAQLQEINMGWKHTMRCTNFKPLKYSMEELVEYLEGVERLETKNPPEINNPNNTSSGLKKTKKGKCKHDEDKKSQGVMENGTSYKKSCKPCELCKMFGGNAELHTTDHRKKRICSPIFLMDTRSNTKTGPRRKSFLPWQKLSRRPL